MSVGIKLNTANFFDRKAVADAIGKVSAYNLSKGGSFIRQNARQSMRSRMKPSAPGTPPSAHSVKHQAKAGFAKRGPLLKNKLFFQFDPSTKSVVIGPESLKQSKNQVPEMHEYGGTFTIRKKVVVKRRKRTKPLTAKQQAAFELLKRNGMLPRRPSTYVTKVCRYPARPYMGPALEKEIQAGTLQGVWADTVK